MVEKLPKEKASEILFENWFLMYEKLTEISKLASIEECNYMMMTDFENIEYWRAVKKELIAL